jgi:hypothetical protein
MQLLKFISNILKKLKKKHKRRIYFHSRGHISLLIFLPNTKNLKYEKTKQAIIHLRIRLMRIYLMQSYPRFARVVWSEEAHRLLKKKNKLFSCTRIPKARFWETFLGHAPTPKGRGA